MDKHFLLDQSQWPYSDGMHYCCLKRGEDLAFILEMDNQTMDGPVILSLGNIFDGGTGKTVKYDSIDHLLNDGWIVD